MMRGLNTYDSFRSIIDRVSTGKRKPDAVIATGDLVQDETRKGYERFRGLVGELNVPVHCIPGNHDSPRIMAEILNEPPFQFCGSAIYQDWCLIMLNSAIRWDDGGQLEASQLEMKWILALLPKLGYNRHMPRAVIFGPKDLGGTGLTKIEYEQIACQTEDIICTIRKGDDMASNYQITIECVQALLGTRIQSF
jgi:predicted MPP superfamily phosphohydrolase